MAGKIYKTEKQRKPLLCANAQARGAASPDSWGHIFIARVDVDYSLDLIYLLWKIA